MKKYIYPALSALAGALIFGVIGFLKLVGIGNDCDMPGKSCDCFCCNSLGQRGYEACGDYGFLVGAGVGVVIGLIIYIVAKKINSQKNNKE
jgi:hypothetical protein